MLDQLRRLRAPHAVLDQRQLAAGSISADWQGTDLYLDGQRISCEAVSGVYTRLTSWAELPEVAGSSRQLERARVLHESIEDWLEAGPAVVVNRTSANDSNHSKPYQLQIIRDYFDVPVTLVTNDPAEVTAFRREIGQIIYKSASGERSIVSRFSDLDAERLPLLASVPVQFQEHVSGVDVRVHVVGSEAFACLVQSAAVDYRYDTSGQVEMVTVDLPRHIVDCCVALTRRLGLELSGIDLRRCNDGRWVCFEVNPSPGYTAFGAETAYRVSHALARRLCGEICPD